MKKALLTSFCVLLAVLSTHPARAAEMAGVSMKDSLIIGDVPASLVGMGVRNIFIVKVYVAGLYMTQPDLRDYAVVHSDQAKAVRMKFIYRKVKAEKLREAWQEGFEKNSPEASMDLKKRMETFVNMFDEDALKGDEYLFTYLPGEGTKVILKGREAGTIKGADFAEALMAIWFGDHPADKGLKKSVLRGSN